MGPGFAFAKVEKYQVQHELSLMARDPEYLKILNEMVKLNVRRPIDQWAHRYIEKFMTLMAAPATRRGHGRVLTQVAQHFGGRINPEDRPELLGLIDRYRSGHLPRMVPIVMIRHHLRYFPDDYFGRQVYLRPHPDEWIVR
ncbi:MAG TPA: DUF1722 domain-containing protein [Acidiferrobacteraceae bacterium]|nr:DUF1722 domain-containing protein [Acidiferrobacteraceae bacterium]